MDGLSAKDKALIDESKTLWWDCDRFDELFKEAESEQCKELLRQRLRWTYHYDEHMLGMD